MDDTVGVTAGRRVVLFGSFAEAACAALVLTASSDTLGNSWTAKRYPVLIFSLSWKRGGYSTLVLRTVFTRVRDEYGTVEKELKCHSHHLHSAYDPLWS